MNFHRHQTSGFSLIEMILSILFIIISIILMLGGIRFLNSVFRETDINRAQREVESVQYLIKNEVRNSQDILHVSSDTLVLSTLTLREGMYDTDDNPNLFQAAQRSRLTYKVEEENGQIYLLRTFDQAPLGVGVNQTKKLLMGYLTRPVLGTTASYIFAPIGTTTPPFQFIKISFPLSKKSFRSAPKTYSIEVSRRSAL